MSHCLCFYRSLGFSRKPLKLLIYKDAINPDLMGDWKQWLTDFGWTQSLLLRSRFGLGSSAHIHGASHYWGAPDAVDGQGIYYLDLGVNHKYEPEADAVEFCAGKS